MYMIVYSFCKNYYNVQMYKYMSVLIGVLFVCLMVFNTTFNNISVISWRSVLLVDETGRPGETLSYNVVHLVLIEIRTHNINGDRQWLHR